MQRWLLHLNGFIKLKKKIKMETRRSFLQKTGLLTGGAVFFQALPDTLKKAMAINPDKGTTFYDAEHIVFLMQENRSFDHALGTLQGVRGFNDPRTIPQPNNNNVWLQTNAAGETYLPFPYDMMGSKITWMGGLPHGWTDQVDARNNGRYDKWLDAKDPGDDQKGRPYTMGYFSRKDIPFYYALADCFTVGDYNFCSALTGTTPNRLYFWSGTIRNKLDAQNKACVWNSDADHGAGEVSWKTYPERLEENGISWKVYQNELYLDVGLGDTKPWLDNFGDNPLEYFVQYQARMHPEYIAYLPEKIAKLSKDISDKENRLATASLSKEETRNLRWDIDRRKKRLEALKEETKRFTKEKWEALPEHIKSIHLKAFATNRNDPHYHSLTKVKYTEQGVEREMDIPRGDILKNFREDVQNGKLPTVSWLAAPEHFSDHPSSAWFGAWYISEVMDILTQNPEVWKKTILILTYDENDGYFDHLAPFVPPHPFKKNSGKASSGISLTDEFVQMNEQSSKEWARESQIGLGYRVPLIIASPWTRGGYVCSEVFDHTSSLQFLENFLTKKTGKKIMEENISQWRRTVCGDLSSAFRPYNGEKITLPDFLDKEEFIKQIHNAKYKDEPERIKKLSDEEIASVNATGYFSSLLPRQEKGIRSANALPYELYVQGKLAASKKEFSMQLKAGNQVFGEQAAGAPFYVYAQNVTEIWRNTPRNYAVKAGDMLQDEWPLGDFENGIYKLHVFGPNGFYRLFSGNEQDPLLEILCLYENEGATRKLSGRLQFHFRNKGNTPLVLQVVDMNYGLGAKTISLPAKGEKALAIALDKSYQWYDMDVKIKGYPYYEQRFAGHIETGRDSKTDPLMGGMLGK
jgi:phospholipase C